MLIGSRKRLKDIQIDPKITLGDIHVQYCRKHTDGKDYLPSVKYIFLS